MVDDRVWYEMSFKFSPHQEIQYIPGGIKLALAVFMAGQFGVPVDISAVRVRSDQPNRGTDG